MKVKPQDLNFSASPWSEMIQLDTLIYSDRPRSRKKNPVGAGEHERKPWTTPSSSYPLIKC